MNRPNLALLPRKLLAGLLVVALASLAVGWTAGRAAASGTTHSATSPTISADKTNSNLAGQIARGEPQVGLNTGTGTASATSGVGGGTSVAYPGRSIPDRSERRLRARSWRAEAAPPT
jgi:hypothetical protein